MQITTCDCPNPDCEAPPHKGQTYCSTPRPKEWSDGLKFMENNPQAWADPNAWTEIAEGLQCPDCDVANPSQRKLTVCR